MVHFETVTTPEAQVGPGGCTVPAGTGVAEADEVVATLEQLDELPVEEHVAVFEQAHDTLRRALDGARADDQVG